VVRGTHVEHWLNGQNVAAFDYGGEPARGSRGGGCGGNSGISRHVVFDPDLAPDVRKMTEP